MIKTLITTALLTLGAMLPSNAQQAQSNCMSYAVLEASLSNEYGEHPFWEGMAANNQMIIQGWVNEESGTWTIVTVLLDGTACLSVYGSQYTFIDPPIPGEDM